MIGCEYQHVHRDAALVAHLDSERRLVAERLMKTVAEQCRVEMARFGCAQAASAPLVNPTPSGEMPPRQDVQGADRVVPHWPLSACVNGHLIVVHAVEFSAASLWGPSSPLLEEEGHVCGFALIAQVDYPRLVH